MSRTKNLADLCAHAVNDIYGELPSRIFAVLERRGRLQISALALHTRLSPRTLRHGLALLVRQGLIYFNADRATNTTHYECNQDAAYSLLRIGKILGIIQARFGDTAKQIAQLIMLHGHIKIGDLANAHKSTRDATKSQIDGLGNGTRSNGTGKGINSEDCESFDETLAQLLEAGLVEPVVESMFLSPTDTCTLAEKEILKERFGGSIKGTKQKDELKSLLNERLREIRSEGRVWKRDNGLKRKSNGAHVNGVEKRRKLANGTTSTNSSYDEIQIDRNLCIRINYEKCTVAIRTQQIVALAAHDIGETTSQVYAEYLRLLEGKISRCRSDPMIDGPDSDDSPFVTTIELSQIMSSSVNVAIGIGKAPQDKVDTSGLDRTSSRSKRPIDEADAESGASSDEQEDGYDNDDVNENGDIPEVIQDSDTTVDDPFAEPVPKPERPAKVTFQDKLPRPPVTEDRRSRQAQILAHLQLLAEHEFITRLGSSGLGEWTVDFEKLNERMRETHLDNIIEQTFGKIGHRLGRLLRQKGKLDEKHLPGLGLLKQKDVRTKLVEMQMAGFVDIQEVPKDNSRAPARTIFLWFFDTERLTMLILDSLYKAMARCMQRLDVEKLKESDILTLADRSDVRAHEEDMLEASQLKRLGEIREKEEKILAQISRLDEMVGVFRDF